jgi:hypothetical protein
MSKRVQNFHIFKRTLILQVVEGRLFGDQIGMKNDGSNNNEEQVVGNFLMFIHFSFA